MPRTITHGEVLRQILDKREITVTQFAELMDMSRQNVYRWFDKEYFKEEQRERIAEAIGIEKDIFLKNETSVNNLVNKEEGQYEGYGSKLEQCKKENRRLKELIQEKNRTIKNQEKVINLLESKTETN